MRVFDLRIAVLALLVISSSSCGIGSIFPNSIFGNNPAPSSCTVSSTPAFVYVLNNTDATISMFTANSCTGALTATSPATVPTGIDTGINAASMVVDPTGQFLYVANLVSNSSDLATISMFTINSTTGVLTPTNPDMVPTGFLPQGIAVDPSGKFIYTANSDDNTISMFTINSSTGLLSPDSPATVSTGSGSSPGFLTVGPS